MSSEAAPTITLYGFEHKLSEPSVSGFCQKLETFFRAAGVAYKFEKAVPFSAPKGKLPYIALEVPGRPKETIPDSHFIIRRLVSSGIAKDLDASLTPSQKAESRAFQAWTEDSAYPAIVLTRWTRPANYRIIKADLPVSEPIKTLLCWYLSRRICSALDGHGVARHSNAEVDLLIEEWVEGVDTRLETGKYFHDGNEPTLVDVMLYGFLVNTLSQRSNPEVNLMLLKKPKIKEYVVRLTRMWFPEYEDYLKVVE